MSGQVKCTPHMLNAFLKLWIMTYPCLNSTDVNENNTLNLLHPILPHVDGVNKRLTSQTTVTPEFTNLKTSISETLMKQHVSMSSQRSRNSPCTPGLLTFTQLTNFTANFSTTFLPDHFFACSSTRSCTTTTKKLSTIPKFFHIAGPPQSMLLTSTGPKEYRKPRSNALRSA